MPDIPSNVAENRRGLITELDKIFSVNREARAKLAKEKPEGWEQEFYRLNDDTMGRVNEEMKRGLLEKFPDLFAPHEMGPKTPQELGREAGPDPADYRKIEAGRTKEFIVFIFRFGPKSEHDGEGAETPLHSHLPGSCALTPYFPGNDRSGKYTTPLEMVMKKDGTADRIFPPKVGEFSAVGGRNDFDEHVVFNGDPDRPAFTVHVYPLEIIEKGEVVNYSDKPLPPTAIKLRSAPGRIDPATHRKDHGRRADGTPLTRADTEMITTRDKGTSSWER